MEELALLTTQKIAKLSLAHRSFVLWTKSGGMMRVEGLLEMIWPISKI